MRENDLNLVTQPWILVRSPEASVQEVSILELFENAHCYQALAGELPSQNVAILRLLLAILYTVFSRFDTEGKPDSLCNISKTSAAEKKAIERWCALWNLKHFPMKPINDYMASVRERFWLFDEQYPFLQVAALGQYRKTDGRKKAKGESKEKERFLNPYKAVKLNSAIDKSANKIRLFASVYEDENKPLQYSEAARWLVHLLGYDDGSLKPFFDDEESKQQRGRIKPGYLGQLGTVYAEGDNLFETLMLNFVAWRDGKEIKPQKPLWEKETYPVSELQKCDIPDNQAELLVYPSRQILLHNTNHRVDEYIILAGQCLDLNEPTMKIEQMTLRKGRLFKKDETQFTPASHAIESFLWQEFGVLFVADDSNSKQNLPGIISWIQRLTEEVEMKSVIRFRSVAVEYGGNDSSFKRVESDVLALHADLLASASIKTLYSVDRMVKYTDQVASALEYFAMDVYKAASGKVPDRKKGFSSIYQTIKADCYQQVDLPFREWLLHVTSKEPVQEDEWKTKAKFIAMKLAEELIQRSGTAAYLGRWVKEKIKGKEIENFYSSPKVYKNFIFQLNKGDQL